jgi:hypothetical protein
MSFGSGGDQPPHTTSKKINKCDLTREHFATTRDI